MTKKEKQDVEDVITLLVNCEIDLDSLLERLHKTLDMGNFNSLQEARWCVKQALKKLRGEE